MQKYIILIIVSLFFLIGCQRHAVVNTHGISYLEKREKLIFVNKSNKNDIVQILGQPATRGMTNNNLWIYIERTSIRGKAYKLGKSHLKKNNVLILEFDKYGVLNKKEFYNKENMQEVNFAKSITENDIRKENFIYGFLSSVRSKMESRRK